MAYLDASIADGQWTNINGWYFISATISTVGIGDFAPEAQLTRGFALVMIPFGLIILSAFLWAPRWIFVHLNLVSLLKPCADESSMNYLVVMHQVKPSRPFPSTSLRCHKL